MYRVLIRLLTFQFAIIQILFKSKNNLVLETIELRQQLMIYQTKKEDSKNITDLTCSLLVVLKKAWPKWIDVLIIVKPETVIYWQQSRFKKYWTEKSAKKNKPGRPSIKLEIRELIKRMASENLSWGAPKYLIFDRNSIFSAQVKQFITSMGTRTKVTGYKCPWQNGVAERYVLSVREDALNRMVIFNEKQLNDFMKQYVEYYNNERCHLSVSRYFPTGRKIQNKPFGSARVISFSRIGGLHHVYKWDKAA